MQHFYAYLDSRVDNIIINVTAQDSEYNIRLMVVGMPNVGKSSLINALRRNYTKQGDLTNFSVNLIDFTNRQINYIGKAARVGKLPGITRAVSTKIQVVYTTTTIFLQSISFLNYRYAVNIRSHIKVMPLQL